MLARVGDRGAEDVAVRGADRLDDVVGRGKVGATEQLTHALDREFAGDFTGLVTSHAVGHDEHPIGDEQIVLVLGAQLSGVGRRPDAQLGHYCASITVVPSWTRSPGCNSFDPTSFVPLWNVPFVEPRSSTIGWPS